MLFRSCYAPAFEYLTARFWHSSRSSALTLIFRRFASLNRIWNVASGIINDVDGGSLVFFSIILVSSWLAGHWGEIWCCSPFVKASDRFLEHFHPVRLFTLTRSDKWTVNKCSCCSACNQICVNLVNVEVTHVVCSCLVFSRRKKAPTPKTWWRLQFMRDGMLLDVD